MFQFPLALYRAESKDKTGRHFEQEQAREIPQDDIRQTRTGRADESLQQV